MNLQSIKQRYGIIGNSPGLNHALSVAVRVASTDLSVLILGESGVGKDVFSKILHNMSPRKHNMLISVNCGAIPEGTIDSELFGHEKGAFTGASDKRKGYFEAVDGGTIFLDEIGEMPLGTQARLLRVLETGEFLKVGSSKGQRTDVRVIAATNVDLLEAVKRGRFREDLYYRLNTVPITIPPLRERREDLYMLFRKFSLDFSEQHSIAAVKLTDEAQKTLINYTWPGNIRELKNIAEQISVLAKDRLVDEEELIQFLPKGQMNRLPVLSGQSRQDAANNNNGGASFSEREIMYKFLLDMRTDMQEMKQAILQLAGHGKISVPATLPTDSAWNTPGSSPASTNLRTIENAGGNGSIVVQSIDEMGHNGYNNTHAEEVEESLSIEEKEKELIHKALQKHKGKRKDAAMDLGISERTLYRKIKEYNIEG